jgi:hypothetical protein
MGGMVEVMDWAILAQGLEKLQVLVNMLMVAHKV